MTKRWPHTGAILAGGTSSRMGRTKENLPFRAGETMLDVVVATLESLTARVVVVGSEVAGKESLPDLRSGAGPLGGIEALLKSEIDEQYLVCPSDIPLVTADLLDLLTSPTTATATIFVMHGEGPVQSLPIRISAEAAAAITSALDAGRNAIHSFLESIDVATVPLTADQAKGLLNINTPEDYLRVSE